MTLKYWRLDRWSGKFRSIESYGPLWQVDHYFLTGDQLPDWLKSDPPLDLSKLDYRFAERPKSKRIPALLIPEGLLYIRSDLYDRHFRNMISNFVTAMPFSISGDAYYFIRPEIEIDCVDLERSEWRQRDDGFRYSWPRLILKNVPEGAPPIFRPGLGREFWKHPVFSDHFVTVCVENRVVGAVFEEVYPADSDQLSSPE